ncbi:MAG: methyltransferase domain-containing protein [Pseudonocardiaceae bacterium]
MTDPGGPQRRLLDELAAVGCLAPEWRPSFLSLPRQLFIPDTVWVPNDGEDLPLVALHRAQDPDRWLELTYANDYVVTQVDDGHPGPDPRRWTATSSASMPLMVAEMLAALDVHDGHRVLEVGTGTGWNAALLAHRLGADQVTSIEIDPDVATRARKALSDAGFGGVTVITDDGALGYPRDAPYDRVIATAACQHIPYPWVEQTRPGGQILTPWANPYFDGGLVALTVGDGGAACGRIVSRSWFMWLRQQRVPRDPLSDIVCPEEQRAELPSTWTDVHPHHVVGDYGAQLAISLRVSQCRHLYSPFDEGEGNGMLWFIDPWSRSWASLTHTTPDASDGEFQVQQFGPRQLWDEVETAHRWWVDAGSPDADRWRFTVTPDGQRVELE